MPRVVMSKYELVVQEHTRMVLLVGERLYIYITSRKGYKRYKIFLYNDWFNENSELGVDMHKVNHPTNKKW